LKQVVSTTTWLRERYNGHEIALKEVDPREYELWIDEKIYHNPNRVLSRDEHKLWQFGRHIIDNLLPDEKHKIILKILEDFPDLKSFYFRNLSVSELNLLYENLQSNNRLSSLAIGSIVIGDKSLTSRGIVFSFSEEEPLVLWQSGFKSICRVEQLKLAPDES
jgi:hypothetical protein